MSFDASRPIIALEISSLGEQHHTGIPNVTKKLAVELMNDTEVESRFFFNRSEIARGVVERMVQLEGGRVLHWIAGRASLPQPLSAATERPVIGLYPTHKWHRRFFPLEVKIVHDLTCVVVPQFHSVENVEFESLHLLGDLISSDLIVAVSESTRDDLRTYFPQVAHIPCIVSHLGPCANPLEALAGDVAPYVLVLGTLEPRKNVEFVLEFLSEHQEVLRSVTFVFVGRFGWGNSSREMVKRYGLAQHVADGAIRFVGFVSDETKDHLLAHASCVVYPSLYEGFGLPALEALSYGTPVITGDGSSLPEVGGGVATYCDVTSAQALASALEQIFSVNAQQAAEKAAARKEWAATFKWTETYRRIKDAALGILQEQKKF